VLDALLPGIGPEQYFDDRMADKYSGTIYETDKRDVLEDSTSDPGGFD